MFPVLVDLCLSGVGKGLFRSVAHFSMGLWALVGPWMLSVVELFLLVSPA